MLCYVARFVLKNRFMFGQLVMAFPDCPAVIAGKVLQLRTDLDEKDRKYQQCFFGVGFGSVRLGSVGFGWVVDRSCSHVFGLFVL